jgi:hypothetical protein
MFIAALSVAAVLAAAPGPATAAPKPPANSCVPADSCRYVPTFTLRGEAGEETVKANTWLPYVSEHGFVVVPGETFVLELRREGERLEPVMISAGRADRLEKGTGVEAAEQATLALSDDTEQVSQAEHPLETIAVRVANDTIRVTFEQAAGKPDMILRVDNGYERTLDYRAVIIRAGGMQREHTSVCLIQPGVIAFEAWPYPIASVELSGFRFVDSPEELELAHCD